MITNNQDILDKLHGIDYIIEVTASKLTTGNDIPLMKNAYGKEVSNVNK